MCCLFLIISETFTEPIGTNLGRNVYWMVLWKVCFCWSKVQRETRGPMVSKRVLSVLILRLWNHWASWYQTWFECSLDGPLESLGFLFRYKRKKQEAQMCQKGSRVVCFCIWGVYFSTNLDWFLYFMLLIKLYLWALLRGVNNLFQFRFFFYFLDSLRYFLPAFVAYQIWPSSCGFRDIMGLRGVNRDLFFT